MQAEDAALSNSTPDHSQKCERCHRDAAISIPDSMRHLVSPGTARLVRHDEKCFVIGVEINAMLPLPRPQPERALLSERSRHDRIAVDQPVCASLIYLSPFGSDAARTIAVIHALTTGGKVGQASITTFTSRSGGTVMGPWSNWWSAPREMLEFSEEFVDAPYPTWVSGRVF